MCIVTWPRDRPKWSLILPFCTQFWDFRCNGRRCRRTCDKFDSRDQNNEEVQICECSLDELIIFANNISCKNNDQFVICSLSMMAVHFQYTSILISFTVVDKTKLWTDSWFGILKSSLLQRKFDCALGVQDALHYTEQHRKRELLVCQGIFTW